MAFLCASNKNKEKNFKRFLWSNNKRDVHSSKTYTYSPRFSLFICKLSSKKLFHRREYACTIRRAMVRDEEMGRKLSSLLCMWRRHENVSHSEEGNRYSTSYSIMNECMPCSSFQWNSDAKATFYDDYIIITFHYKYTLNLFQFLSSFEAKSKETSRTQSSALSNSSGYVRELL